MTKNFCKKCGSALTKSGAKFCTTCGATVDGAEIGDISSQETRDLPGEQKDQTAFATEVIPAVTPPTYETTDLTAFGTEVIPAVTPPSYVTEEMPRTAITGRTEERATEVIEAIAPPTVPQAPKKQKKHGKKKQPSVQQPEGQPGGRPGKQSGGRKKLAVAAALGVLAGVALVAAAFFFINSRKGPEAQAGTQPVAKVESSPSAQPNSPEPNLLANQQPGQPSDAGANNQAQSQTRPQPGPSIGQVKSPAVRNDESASNQQRQAAAKPTPTLPQEKQAAGGISAAEHENQGITYMNSGRYQEALQEFEYVKKLDPGNKDVYYLFGSTYQRMNQLQQALEAYRQCTAGKYSSTAQSAVKNLEKKVGKVSAR